MDSTFDISRASMNTKRLSFFLLTLSLFSIAHISVPCAAAAFTSGGQTPASETRSLSLCCSSDGYHSNIPGTYTNGETTEKKSKSRARLYSIAATTVPMALAMLNARGYRLSEQSGTSIILISAGILVGPSAGSIYADDRALANRSILIRSASAAILVSGHFIKKNENLEALGLGLQFSSGLFLAGHALYDIFFLSAHSVEYHNATIRMEAGLSFFNPVQQTVQTPDPELRINPKLLPGLGIRLSF